MTRKHGLQLARVRISESILMIIIRLQDFYMLCFGTLCFSRWWHRLDAEGIGYAGDGHC